MRALKGCVRALGSLIGLVIKLAIMLGAAAVVLASLSSELDSNEKAIPAAIGAIVFLFMFWRIFIHPASRRVSEAKA